MLLPPRAGAENMARDVALMERARETREVVFSAYQWMRPTLSLGRNEMARNRYDCAGLERLGMDVVRRPTGGRALVHHREVTYSVTAPLDGNTSLREWYARINRVLVRALASIGVVAAEAAGGPPAQPPDGSPCFAKPARGEILVNGRKLVGSAQWRNGGALLQHGSILIADDQHLISQLSLSGSAVAYPAPATLASLLDLVPDVAEVAAALFGAVHALEDPEACELDESEIRPAALDRITDFENELWTWRR